MSTVAELLTWSSTEADLREYCSAPDASFSDTVLQIWFDAAVEAADDFLGRDFSTLPSQVKLGVFEYVKAFVGAHGVAGGVKSQKVGDVAESYAPTLEMASLALHRAKPYWTPKLEEIQRLG